MTALVRLWHRSLIDISLKIIYYVLHLVCQLHNFDSSLKKSSKMFDSKMRSIQPATNCLSNCLLLLRCTSIIKYTLLFYNQSCFILGLQNMEFDNLGSVPGK